ncbi:MAG: bifunctional heptose 7-phosphate kinase/heptose 1-phosphate adenyltransferase [Planctomycetota bacterium]|nr:bifunctional heptose 7-phosphate kinase/heptose 1-phosphate adenyltransferase [Planctomycetota bacterium]
MLISQLTRIVEETGRPRIALVGDLMLDEYIWGDVQRISPEAPIPVLRVGHREIRAGGAGSVAVNLGRLDVDVHVFSVIGEDSAGDRILSLLESEGCNVSGVVRDGGRPTTLKARHMGYVQHSHRAVQQMLRVDEEDLSPVTGLSVDELLERMFASGEGYDAVLVSDYGKGLVSSALMEGIHARCASAPVLVDPARTSDYSAYRASTLICPNRFEAELASGVSCSDLEGCREAAGKLREEFGFQSVVVTMDREGMFVDQGADQQTHLPTRASLVADVTGAGDMVLAVLGLVAAAGKTAEEGARVANVAAGLVVRQFGVVAVSRKELLAEIQDQGNPAAGKVKSLEELSAILSDGQKKGLAVVFTNGCFDLLHPGHHHLLNEARREGDLLVVAVNSDSSISRLKGEGRPRIGESDRVKMLAGLEAVDYVILFEEDTPLHLVQELVPDVLVKGGDYRDDAVVGQDIVEKNGGRMVFIDRLPGLSTTELLGEEEAEADQDG